MKKYLVLILAVVIFACSQEKGFKIKVNLDGAKGKVLLEKRSEGAWVGVDTADIVDGTAILKGEVEYPSPMYLSVLGSSAKALIFVENADMTVTGSVDSIYQAKVTGSLTHSQYDTINRQIADITQKYMAIYQNARAATAVGDTAKAEELMKEVNTLYESVGVLQEDFVKQHPASYVAPYFLVRIQYGKTADELDELVNSLDPKLKKVETVQDLISHIEKMKAIAVGKKAPDFTQNDPDGNPVKFSDIYSKNELTLLDFWASWCGPCRGENPNVVAVYNQYKDKGFSVFGVSLDKDKAKWLEAIEKDHLTWDHVSDLAYWQNAAAKQYAVRSIPSNLLVDKSGKIVAKNKRGEDLGKFVKDFFSK